MFGRSGGSNGESSGTVWIDNVSLTEVQVPVKKIEINQQELKMAVGDSKDINVSISPKNASNKELNWTSSDASVVSVSNGEVTALKEGKAIVTVSSVSNPNIQSSCQVTVKDHIAVTDVQLNKQSITLREGKRRVLNAQVKPVYASYKEVTWNSSNPKVATVHHGLIKGVESGTAIITVTTKDGHYTDQATVKVQSYETGSFDRLRKKWKEFLTGGKDYDSSDEDIDNYINDLVTKVTNKDRTGYWDTMNTSGNHEYLWSDLKDTVDPPSYMTNSYKRLKTMALAYVLKGSSLYHNVALRKDILYGLEWLYKHRYNPSKQEYGNWWHWEIGTPMVLKDILVLMYPDLTSSQIEKYTSAIEHFVPNPTSSVGLNRTPTGANRIDKALIVAVSGIVAKDEERVIKARDSLSQLFKYVKDGDGFYRDGSFIQHNDIAYTGSYGVVLINHLSDLLYLLSNSPFHVTDPHIDNVYQWAFDSFQPLMYKGAMMDMVRGRAISRQEQSAHATGRTVAVSLLRIAQGAPDNIAKKMKSMIKYWIKEDSTFENYYSGLNISDMVMVKSLMSNQSIKPRGPLVGHYQFPSMDRIVHHRKGWTFAISMYSSRIQNYESINSENLEGWYTGSGMTYLYNNDLDQYSNAYWPTVNSLRLPGVTTNREPKPTTRSSKSWVGGTSINNLYGIAGMAFAYKNSTLNGKKSWFMFDDEVVGLGAGISSQGNNVIESIIANRQINQKGSNKLIIDGETMPTKLGWSQELDNVKWVHLEGNEPHSDIGYFFPKSADIMALRQARTGSWSDINKLFTTDSSSITRNYLTMYFDHGVKPEHAKYSYVLLPNKSIKETKNYNENPDIKILSNTNHIQAVKAKELGITAVNFWKSGEISFIRSYQPASIMVQEKGDTLTLSVSDPTQKQDRIVVELGKIGLSVLSKDERVTVLRKHPYIKVAIDTKGAMGKAQIIKFKYKSGGELPPTSKIAVHGDSEIQKGAKASISVKVTNNSKTAIPKGEIRVSLPEGWSIHSKEVIVSSLKPNESDTVHLTFKAPEHAEYGKHKISMVFEAGQVIRNVSYTMKVIPVIGTPQRVIEYKLKSVKASAVPQKENSPKNTLDGELNTRWSAPGDQWIQYDLGEIKPITHASVGFYKGDIRSAIFEIQVSKDGKHWTTLFNGKSSGRTEKLETYAFQKTQARYVRILGHGNTNSDWNSITEVNIYGPYQIKNSSDLKDLVKHFKKEGAFASDRSVRALSIHLSIVSIYEQKGLAEKVVKHMKGFKYLLSYQKENHLISDKAYEVLKAEASQLIAKW